MAEYVATTSCVGPQVPGSNEPNLDIMADKRLQEIMGLVLRNPASPASKLLRTMPDKVYRGIGVPGKMQPLPNPSGCASLLLSLLGPNSPITSSLILSHLSIPTILSLTKVCKELRHIIPTHWNINAHLRRWVTSPAGFRALQSRTSAICGGSDALQFLLREEWDCDLNIFVEKMDAAMEWVDYLESEGYYFEPAFGQIQCENFEHSYPCLDPTCSIENTFDGLHEALSLQVKPREEDKRWEILYDMKHMRGFHPFTHQKDLSKRVKLIITSSDPLYCMIRSFPVSPAFCFYTSSKCYSLFPYTTFVKRKQYQTRGHNALMYQAKYMRHGFELAEQPRNRKKWPMRHHRRIDDKYSWVIKFDGGIENKAVHANSNLIDTATFNVVSTSRATTREHSVLTPVSYAIYCQQYTSTSLKQKYIVDGGEPEDRASKMSNCGSWAAFLERKLKGYKDMQRFVNPYGTDEFTYDEYMEGMYKEWSATSDGLGGNEVVTFQGHVPQGDLGLESEEARRIMASTIQGNI